MKRTTTMISQLKVASLFCLFVAAGTAAHAESTPDKHFAARIANIHDGDDNVGIGDGVELQTDGLAGASLDGTRSKVTLDKAASDAPGRRTAYRQRANGNCARSAIGDQPFAAVGKVADVDNEGILPPGRCLSGFGGNVELNARDYESKNGNDHTDVAHSLNEGNADGFSVGYARDDAGSGSIKEAKLIGAILLLISSGGLVWAARDLRQRSTGLVFVINLLLLTCSVFGIVLGLSSVNL